MYEKGPSWRSFQHSIWKDISNSRGYFISLSQQLGFKQQNCLNRTRTPCLLPEKKKPCGRGGHFEDNSWTKILQTWREARFTVLLLFFNALERKLIALRARYGHWSYPLFSPSENESCLVRVWNVRSTCLRVVLFTKSNVQNITPATPAKQLDTCQPGFQGIWRTRHQ